MSLTSSRLGYLGLCLLLTCSCSDNPTQNGLPSGPVIGGNVHIAPDLSGSWLFNMMVNIDECGMDLIHATDERVFQISQAQNDLVFAVFDECGASASQGSGTVDDFGVTVVSFEEAVDLAGDCSLGLAFEISGTADSPGEMINGSFVVTVAPVDDDHNCGITLPCNVTGTFSAQACPPASCELQVCGA